MTGMSLNMTVTALAGKTLAADPAWSTVPLALQFAAMMVTTMPASLFMQRFGRRPGFVLAVFVGVAGSLCAAQAIKDGSFLAFCAGSMMIGVFQGFALFYRHAAADTASAAFRPKAISLVLAGGVVSAVAGPQLAKETFDLFAPFTFLGSFLAAAAVQALVILPLLFVQIPKPARQPEGAAPGRPLMEIASQPKFIVAAVGAMLGYGIMTFVMTATPLAVVACGFGFEESALVIQWHVLGMFVPSFFTGLLISRFGVLRVMMAGAILYVICVAVNLSEIELAQFLAGLLLLGVGWNFLFVGGTALLAECHTPEERGKVQGLNDLMVSTTMTASSFAAGSLHHYFGWTGVNIGVLPLVLVVGALIAWQMTRPRTAAA